MTLNDIETNERCLRIRQLAEMLPKLMRDGQESMLFVVVHEISCEAEAAKERLNRVRWAPKAA